MNLSGILVVVQSEHLSEAVAALDALPGVEVHYRDDNTGRLIVVQEAASVHDEVEGLKRIKASPHVIVAELVYHYLGDEERADTDMPMQLEALASLSGAAVSAIRKH